LVWSLQSFTALAASGRVATFEGLYESVWKAWPAARLPRRWIERKPDTLRLDLEGAICLTACCALNFFGPAFGRTHWALFLRYGGRKKKKERKDFYTEDTESAEEWEGLKIGSGRTSFLLLTTRISLFTSNQPPFYCRLALCKSDNDSKRSAKEKTSARAT